MQHQLRILQLLGVLALGALSTEAQSTKPLLSGSLTWAIDPAFVQGKRLVKFTLLTAFEVTPEDDCTFELNQEVQCSSPAILERFGRLCIDRYLRQWSATSSRMTPVLPTYSGLCPVDENEPVLQGARNNFVVMDKRNINGLNVVFGKKEVTAKVNPTTTGLVAHLMLDAQVESKRTGVLLPQCVTNPAFLKVPCAVNAFHDLTAPIYERPSTTFSDPNSTETPAPPPAATSPHFGLFKEEECGIDGCTYESSSLNIYWRGFTSPLEDFAKEGSNLFKITPALETFVPLCTSDPSDIEHNCSSILNPLTNYFSPVPAFPPFVEVAVTPYSQARSDPDSHFVEQDSGETYAAPHPAMFLKSMDYDGHQISHYDPLTAEARGMSNLRLECFEWLNASEPRDLLSLSPGAWPESVRWEDGPGQRAGSTQCKRFFDSDGTPGPRFKFDFDFGANPSLNPLQLKRSQLFLDQFLLCADGSVPADGARRVCAASGEVVAQGNRMFAQHVLNTVDLPFIDVDNRDVRFPHVSDLPNWRYTPTLTDLVTRLTSPPIPESAMVQSVIASYPCFSGSQNLPPKFVTGLDSVPDVLGKVALEAAYDNVTTEVECMAGADCIIPLFAQDFDWTVVSGGVVDVKTGTNCYSRPANLLTEPALPDAGYQSCDVVQIELLPGMYAPTPPLGRVLYYAIKRLTYRVACYDHRGCLAAMPKTERVVVLLAGWHGPSGKSLHRAVCSEDASKPCVRDGPGCTCAGTAEADAERPLVCESSEGTAGMGGAGERGHGAVKCFYKEMMPAE
eukprot:1203900-Rhodomonas_salina.1